MKKMLIILSTIGFLILVALLYGMQGKEIKVSKVVQGNIWQSIEEAGVIKAKKSQTAYLEGTGRIIEIFVEEGNFVHKGELLLKLESATNMQLAEVAVKQALIGYEEASKDWEKVQKLFAENLISKDTYDKTKAAYDGSKASLDSAYLEKKKLEDSITLKAPIAGIILAKMIELNTFATPGTPAFIIGSPQDLEVTVDVLADDIVDIREGNLTEISGKSTGDKLLQGKVVKIAPMAQTIVSSLGVNQKRVTVTISLLSKADILKPGINVDVKIITKIKKNTLKIPATAIFDYQGVSHIFVVENRTARLRKIEKGIENDEEIEVISGIQVGELVIEKPENDLQDGMKIKPFLNQ